MTNIQQQKKVLLAALFLCVGTRVCGSTATCVDLDGHKTCYTTEKSPYRFYGTKTAYHVAVPNDADGNFSFGRCEPILFYLLSRHATRYPGKEEIEEMVRVLPVLQKKAIDAFAEGRSGLCADDIERLQLWSMASWPGFDKNLSESGKLEAKNLAERYRKRIPSLLNRKFSSQHFKFEYTSRRRTQTTAEAFAEGLFGKLGATYMTGKTNDPVLQFHRVCKSLMEKCNTTSEDAVEAKMFRNGHYGRSLVSSVSKRLGFGVTDDEVQLMYKACVFGYAVREDDIWCSAFSGDDLKVLEYSSDLKDYHKDTYGKKINYEQACPVIKYMFNLLTNHSSASDMKAVLQFTHSGAMKKIYTALGLFKDSTVPTADNFCYMHRRKWKSSLVVPFNSNIAFVLLQCGGKKKLIAYHNEKPVMINGCNTYLCPIEDFRAQYKTVAASCDINRLCCSCCSH